MFDAEATVGEFVCPKPSCGPPQAVQSPVLLADEVEVPEILRCDENGCQLRRPSGASTSSMASTDVDSLPTDADAPHTDTEVLPSTDPRHSTLRFGSVATVDVHSPECIRELAIGLARHCGMPVSTMGTLDQHVVKCGDVEAARRLAAMDDAISALAQQFIEVTGMRGRRANAFADPDEPLTTPDPTRFAHSDKPIPAIHEMVKKQEASVWFVEEIDLACDRFDELDADTQFFIENVLAFFAASDGIVANNLSANVQSAFTVPEIRHFFAWQEAMEMIHSETYALLLSQYVRDERRRAELRRAIETLPCVKKKAEWAIEWSRPHRRLCERLVAYACVEGIHFSGSFCAIFYLKKRGVMPGLTFSNELIARDEGMHCDFGCLLHSMLHQRCHQATAHGIIQSAVDVELEFVTSSLPVSLLGMNASLMCCYIRFVANRLCHALGFDSLYAPAEAYNPFDWMELISLQGKTNFFEKRVGEYQRANVMNAVLDPDGGRGARVFTTDADF